MSGLPDIDVEDWQSNTEYSGSYDTGTPIITVSALCLPGYTVTIT